MDDGVGREKEQMVATAAKTLVKGVDLLRHFVGSPGSLTLAQLAAETGWPKPTLLRVLGTLVEQEMLEHVGGAYRLGVGCLDLSEAYLDHLRIRRLSAPLLSELRTDLNETCHLGVRDDLTVVYVDKVEGQRSVRMHSAIGTANPLHCTGVGKAILAFSAPELTDRVVAAGLEQRTRHTVATSRALHRALDETRRRGYAIDDQENEIGLRCAAAPIVGRDGQAAAAISASIPAFRFPRSAMTRIGTAVQRAADRIGQELQA